MVFLLHKGSLDYLFSTISRIDFLLFLNVQQCNVHNNAMYTTMQCTTMQCTQQCNVHNNAVTMHNDVMYTAMQ